MKNNDYIFYHHLNQSDEDERAKLFSNMLWKRTIALIQKKKKNKKKEKWKEIIKFLSGLYSQSISSKYLNNFI